MVNHFSQIPYIHFLLFPCNNPTTMAPRVTRGTTSWKDGLSLPCSFQSISPLLTVLLLCGLKQPEDFSTQASGSVYFLHQSSLIIWEALLGQLHWQALQGKDSSTKEGHCRPQIPHSQNLTLLSHQPHWGPSPDNPHPSSSGRPV